MRIAVILSRVHWWGSSRYALEVARKWAEKGHEVHIFANSWDPLDHPKVIFHKVPSILKGHMLPREAWLTLAHSIVQKFQKFDVTLAQPTRYFTPDVGEVQFLYKSWVDWKRRKGMKDSVPIKISDAWLGWMEKRNVRKVRHMIALAECVKKDIIEGYGIDPAKVTLAYSGTNLEEFRPENRTAYRQEIRARHGIADNDMLFIFVGNPYIRKGLDRVIEALPALGGRNYKLLICGKDNPEPFKQLAERLGVADKLVWNVGLTSEIKKYFAAADAFVFPTRYEPFGLVITEAMASGLPAITTKLSGAAELIEDGKDGLLMDDPEDVVTLKSYMIRLADDSALRSRMGAAARSKIEQYTWDRTADVMMEVLEKVVAEKNGRTN